jgi:serine phosphatase RsbU (regulator of sigma subunit)
MSTGDLLCLYTDGVTEAFRDDGEEFGRERLIEALVRERTRPAREIIDLVVASLREFAESDSLADDVTLVVVRVT